MNREEAREFCQNMPMRYQYDNRNIDDLVGQVRRHKDMNIKLRFVIIDYVQLIECSKFSSDTQNEDYIVKELQKLAQTEDLVVIALSQLNKQSFGEEVTMQSFKGSSTISQAANYMFGMWMPYRAKDFDMPQRRIILSVLKAKDYPTGKYKLVFTGESFSFTEEDWDVSC